MAKNKPEKLKNRVIGSWITSSISITLVLILLGGLLLMVINAERLSNYIREKIGFTLILQDDLKDVEITRLEKTINASDYAKSTTFISKEDAAKELKEELGEDFSEFLGYNPLFSSFEIKLHAPYTNADSLQILEKKLRDYPQVKEVYYQENLVTLINQNVKKASIIFLIVSAFMLFIFVALINNTIRVSIYAERFKINTMQMVGASNGFIRRPFLKKSLVVGLIGAIIASAVLIAVLYTYSMELNGFFSEKDMETAAIISGAVLILGLAISYLSTYFAVNKYLKMRLDEMFY